MASYSNSANAYLDDQFVNTVVFVENPLELAHSFQVNDKDSGLKLAISKS
jgi:hypothetical protein